MQNDQRVNSGSSSTLPLQACFFSSGASFSSIHPLLFHTPLQSALSKGNLLFIALCGGMQGRKEGGQNNGFCGNRARKPTQSPCYFFLVLDHHNGWTVISVSVFEERYFDWQYNLSSHLCLFKRFLETNLQPCLLELWRMTFAVGLQ